MTLLRTLSSLVALGVFCVPATALQDDAAAPGLEPLDVDEWEFEFAPYIWLPADIDGSSTVAGVTVELDLSLGDIFDNFDVFALTGRLEAWKGDQWGIIFDGMYVGLDGDFDVDLSMTNTLTLEGELTGPAVVAGVLRCA